MKEADFENYLMKRYEDQTKWYSDSASKNKKFYIFFQWGVIILFFQWGVIILSASLPVLIASVPESRQWVTVILSILLAIGTAGLKTFKFQENWINYRTISETLIKEKHYYDADLDEYGDV